jgi:hypothetical protein
MSNPDIRIIMVFSYKEEKLRFWNSDIILKLVEHLMKA